MPDILNVMNKKAVIVHGAYGSPNENWFPWLGEELEKLGYTVYKPDFPTPKRQSLEAWKDRFDQYRQSWGDGETILIGHSIGSAFVLRMLMAHIGSPIKAAFLVAGFVTQLGNPEFDKLNASFLENPFDWELIKKNCRQFFVYHSDNDPYVLLERGQELTSNLGVEMILVEDAGHFNENAGYTTFSKLLHDVKKL